MPNSRNPTRIMPQRISSEPFNSQPERSKNPVASYFDFAQYAFCYLPHQRYDTI
jgi:hypothetical protein